MSKIIDSIKIVASSNNIEISKFDETIEIINGYEQTRKKIEERNKKLEEENETLKKENEEKKTENETLKKENAEKKNEITDLKIKYLERFESAGKDLAKDDKSNISINDLFKEN